MSDERGTMRVPPWVGDALLAVGVVATVAVVISANQGGRQDADLLAYLWAVGLGGLMLVRRRYPLIVLAISVFGLFAYYAAGYPAIGVAVPVAAAVFSAAERGRLLWSVVAAAVVLVVSVGFRLAEGQQFSTVVGYELAGHVLLLAAAVALGDSIRSRRDVAASAERLAQAAAEEERHLALAAEHETRTRIARDLHDSVGHSVTVMSLHADVAREAVGVDDTAAREALRVVKDTSRSVMHELRATVRRLREPDAEPGNHARLRDVERDLLDGVPIAARVDIRVSPSLPPAVDEAAYRIVQEALTNVVRHANASRVDVIAVERDGVLLLEIVDDGTEGDSSPSVAPVRGVGILGMRERAAAVGGELVAGREDGGFAIRASLPLERLP